MMGWLGIGGSGVAVRLKELEYSIRTRFHVSRTDPAQELPDVDLPHAEQRNAVRQEAARRMITERK